MDKKWINFKDKLPRNGTFTVQRETPETPEELYTHGCFYNDPAQDGWRGFDKYRKTAQWQQDVRREYGKGIVT